jgi:hypothetical protein
VKDLVVLLYYIVSWWPRLGGRGEGKDVNESASLSRFRNKIENKISNIAAWALAGNPRKQIPMLL